MFVYLGFYLPENRKRKCKIFNTPPAKNKEKQNNIRGRGY